jgi:hypothetical protein
MSTGNTDDPYPPLMSPRSPSYARARREFEHPSPTGDPNLVAALARLSELEENARRGCLTAAQTVDDPELAVALRLAGEDHDERRRAIGEMVVELGGSAPRIEECRGLLAHNAETIERAARASGTRGICAELRDMRNELASAYREVSGESGWSDAQRTGLAALAP